MVPFGFCLVPVLEKVRAVIGDVPVLRRAKKELESLTTPFFVTVCAMTAQRLGDTWWTTYEQCKREFLRKAA